MKYWFVHFASEYELLLVTTLQVTSPLQRNWTISPFGSLVFNFTKTNEPVGEGVWTPLQVWAMFAAFLPAILLYALLFMETHICE